MDLFEHANESSVTAPLADRIRPRRLEDLVGQEAVLGPEGFLARAIAGDNLPSLLLWGPPGSGKTTLARIVASYTRARFVPFSAVLGGVKDVRVIIEEARRLRRATAQRTILFVDEIHRFNKAQQDAFLPHVEDGTVILIGATTENPSFYVNSALLSRCRLVRLEALGREALMTLMTRALRDEEKGLGSSGVQVPEAVLARVATVADGDARRALNLLEQLVTWAHGESAAAVSVDDLENALGSGAGRYDRAGDEHYDTVSAFIKSLRGSDPDAAMYYMTRMLENGEDPLFLLRRMVIFAAEDVGNADPRALQVAVAATEAFRFLGLPEGAIPMAQACTYLASAPKSKAAYDALQRARRDAREAGSLPIPKHLRNAPTGLMKELGHGEGYVDPHKRPGHFAAEPRYLPEALAGRRYYEPTDQGLEQKIGERLARLRQARERALCQAGPGDDNRGERDEPNP